MKSDFVPTDEKAVVLSVASGYFVFGFLADGRQFWAAWGPGGTFLALFGSLWGALAAISHAQLDSVIEWEALSPNDFARWGIEVVAGKVSVDNVTAYPGWQAVSAQFPSCSRHFARNTDGEPIPFAFSDMSLVAPAIRIVKERLAPGRNPSPEQDLASFTEGSYSQ